MQQNPNLFAGLGPFAGLAQAGSQLATRGIQGLFGIKDPVLERNRILAQTDYNDPASLQAAAQGLAQAGFVDQAMGLAGQARQLTQQERQFGLESRRVAATEKTAEQGDERLQLSRDELEFKKEEFEKRSDLTDVQIRKAKKELDNLDKNYTPSLYRDNEGNALFTKTGEIGYWYFDDATQTIKRHNPSKGMTTIKPPTPSSYDFLETARALAATRNAQKTNDQPLAAGPPQGRAGGSLADIQARARAALEQKQK